MGRKETRRTEAGNEGNDEQITGDIIWEAGRTVKHLWGLQQSWGVGKTQGAF